MPVPRPVEQVTQNPWDFLREPMIAPTGFREYDARWRFPEEIYLPGIQALGLGIGTQMHAMGIRPDIAVGNDRATGCGRKRFERQIATREDCSLSGMVVESDIPRGI